jgi:ribonuclease D
MTLKNLSHNGNNSISKEEITGLPLRSFKGKIVLVKEANALAKVFREIEEHTQVGFDTETRPSFRKGESHQVSLLQLAIPQKVFLIRLNYTGLTKEIISFMENDTLAKAGVGIRDDIKALHKLNKFHAAGFEELSILARQAGLQVESVKKLAALLLGFRISKSAQTSNWEAEKLSEKQLEYAATDAWVCLEIYNRLRNSHDSR